MNPRTKRRKRPWLFFLCVGLSLAAFAVNHLLVDVVAPYTTWGQAYGAIAAALMTGILFFGIRRRFMGLATKLKLGRANAWLNFHIYGGALFLLLLLMHTGFRIPHGSFSSLLFVLSLWTVLSGWAGHLLQRWLPTVMASGLSNEVLYERIPELIDNVRYRMAQLVSDCSQPVRAFYKHTLAPSLSGPQRRFIYFLDITGGIQNRLQGFEHLRAFLQPEEIHKLDELERLFKTKLEMDAHFTLQQALRGWLFLHVPPALMLLGMVALHLIAVFYY